MWFAIIAVVIGCALAVSILYLSKRRSRNGVPAVIVAINDNAIIDIPFDAARWALLNPWLTEGQSNDRRPVPGTDGDGSGSQSARRSSTRRAHQANYKKWSQARHD